MSDLEILEEIRGTIPIEEVDISEIGNVKGVNVLYYSLDSESKVIAVHPKELESSLQLLEQICQLSNLKTLFIGFWLLKDLSKSIGNLTNLQYLFINGQFQSLPESIGNLTNLQSLSIDGSSLQGLPESIGNLSKLQTLSIIGELFENLPESIGNLTDLKELSINSERFKNLPNSIEKLSNLESLIINCRELQKLPKNIGSLSNLRNLSICNNIIPTQKGFKTQLQNLPEDIKYLSNLQTLSINSEQLQSLPDTIGNLSNLQLFEINSNQLQSLPHGIGNLTNLQSLSIDGGSLQSLPESIGNLSNLQSLRINGGNLKGLPESIGNLSNLQSLFIYASQLQSLPESIGNLTNLQSLSIYSLQIQSLPKSIWNLSNLQSLRINDKQLQSLLDSIQNLSKLKKLHIDGQLKSLPESIGNLSNLKELFIYASQLQSLPESIGNLSNLQSLRINGGNLKGLPESIGNLSNLQSLFIYASQLQSLPESIGNLTNLQSLSIYSKQLQSLPESIGNLSNLQFLDIGDNPLKSLPKDIGNLSNLKTLYIHKAQIQNLPDSFIQLTNLEYLTLPSSLEPALLNSYKTGGIRGLQDYLRQQKEQGTMPLYEAKIIIVGEPAAGKTTLLRKMQDVCYPVPNDKDKDTVGVNIFFGWEFHHTEKENTKCYANIWDFGGQEIQYMTHQFFMTERALYILVGDDRAQNTRFDYWFYIVSILGKHSNLLVLLNHKNTNQPIPTNFDEKKYRELFADISFETRKIDFSEKPDYLETKALLQCIQKSVSNLPYFGEEVPAKWPKIKDKLLEIKAKNYIPYKEFIEICSSFELSEKDALLMSRNFHQIGLFLHFQDDPILKRIVFLNPQWVANAIYILFKNDSIQNNKGMFSKEYAIGIWEKEGYQELDFTYLFQLMEKDKFEVCFKNPYKDDEYIAPILLPSIKPNYEWDKKGKLQYRYLYPFMPEGLLARLCVRLHDKIKDNLIWKDGLVIKNEDSEAEIEYSTSREDGTKNIYITISGKNPRPLLHIIRNELQRVHESVFRSGLEEDKYYQALLPCICGECKDSDKPEFYELKTLKNLRDNKGKKTKECPKSGDGVPIDKLIEDIEHPETSKSKGSFELESQKGKNINNTINHYHY